jgi:AmiR/NasT family two-component response regulator
MNNDRDVTVMVASPSDWPWQSDTRRNAMNKNRDLTVMIAEDDALINGGIATQLFRLGYPSAGQAYDGVEAVEMACRTRPSVVLMDLQMIDPETGREDGEAGIKAARAIQQRCPAAVVVLSAHESPDLIRQAAEAGVSGYLVKPASDRDLDRMLTIVRARFDELLKLRATAVELERHRDEIQATLALGKTLSGLLSICAWCNKIRDDQGSWLELKTYVQQRSEVKFSHGICPECRTRFPR